MTEMKIPDRKSLTAATEVIQQANAAVRARLRKILLKAQADVQEVCDQVDVGSGEPPEATLQARGVLSQFEMALRAFPDPEVANEMKIA